MFAIKRSYLNFAKIQNLDSGDFFKYTILTVQYIEKSENRELMR